MHTYEASAYAYAPLYAIRLNCYIVYIAYSDNDDDELISPMRKLMGTAVKIAIRITRHHYTLDLE
jgi:hypothetical protein